MRVTAEVRQRTRQRIVAAARELFAARGFEATSTREIAAAAAIAAGTPFNYFESKEALGMELLVEDLEQAHADFLHGRRGEKDVVEDLFALNAAELRRLEPHRAWAVELFETALSPFVRRPAAAVVEARAHHLEIVARILEEHGVTCDERVGMHLYWSLHLGVLAAWCVDSSPSQEDTLALLGHSLELFVAALD